MEFFAEYEKNIRRNNILISMASSIVSLVAQYVEDILLEYYSQLQCTVFILILGTVQVALIACYFFDHIAYLATNTSMLGTILLVGFISPEIYVLSKKWSMKKTSPLFISLFMNIYPLGILLISSKYVGEPFRLSNLWASLAILCGVQLLELGTVGTKENNNPGHHLNIAASTSMQAIGNNQETGLQNIGASSSSSRQQNISASSSSSVVRNSHEEALPKKIGKVQSKQIREDGSSGKGINHFAKSYSPIENDRIHIPIPVKAGFHLPPSLAEPMVLDGHFSEKPSEHRSIGETIYALRPPGTIRVDENGERMKMGRESSVPRQMQKESRSGSLWLERVGVLEFSI